MPVPPANIIDIGTDEDAGSWLEMLAFSPCLNVSDYAGRQLTEAGSVAPVSFHHDQPDSAGGAG
jgi:hypothetical protein